MRVDSVTGRRGRFIRGKAVWISGITFLLRRSVGEVPGRGAWYRRLAFAMSILLLQSVE